MAKIHLRAIIPSNRDFNGTMTVFVDDMATASFPIKGRGSRGQGDTVYLKNGNTPQGEYKGRTEDTTNWNDKSYGPNGAIRLHPIGGDALIATKIFGRSGLLIHGGSPAADGYWEIKGGLRPTHGCLRLSNENMKALMKIISASKNDANLKMCVEPEVTISVYEK